MKNLVLLSLATALFAAYIPASNASNFGEMMCQYVHQDDKKRLRNLLRTNNVKIRNIYKDIQCNGENVLDFAVTSNATKTAKMIISKLPKTAVEKSMAKMQASGNAEVVSAAEARVSG